MINRIITFDAYIEGWAKYAETLPYDQGVPYPLEQELFSLRAELISTVNLVLDTGIHEKGWTREFATSWFCEQTGMPVQFAQYIVGRSCAVPAQMCAYKIGLMKVRELKEVMENSLGNQFRLVDFHQRILQNGSLPLSVLEKEFSCFR